MPIASPSDLASPALYRFDGAKVAPVIVCLEEAESPQARLERITRLCLPRILEEHRRASAQSDEEMVVIVASMDCAVGQIMGQRVAPQPFARAVEGALVWACALGELQSMFGEKSRAQIVQEIEALGPRARGEILVALGVNGGNLDLRVLRPFTRPAEPLPDGAGEVPLEGKLTPAREGA